MVKLKEVSEIVSGYYFRTSVANFDTGDIMLIQPSDLDDFNIEKLITIDAPKTKLKKGDILLSNRGKFRAMVMDKDGDFIFPSSIFMIRLKSKKYLPGFISSYINSDSGQAQLLFLSSGAYIPNLTKISLDDFELPDVTLDYQSRIAEIDSDLTKYRRATNQKSNLLENIKNYLIKELK